jgi:sigma-B regulation protein RsbU (phosphoserine phosphatase)
MIVLRRDGAVEMVDTIDLGFPVGLEQDISAFVDQTCVRLQPGDGVVLYTDGITEAENMANEQYGVQRLTAVLKAHWAASAEMIKRAVVADLKKYIGSQIVYDDITLVVAKQT